MSGNPKTLTYIRLFWILYVTLCTSSFCLQSLLLECLWGLHSYLMCLRPFQCYYYCLIGPIFTLSEYLSPEYKTCFSVFSNWFYISNCIPRDCKEPVYEYLTQELYLLYRGFDPNLPVTVTHSLYKQSYIISSLLPTILQNIFGRMWCSLRFLSFRGFRCSVCQCPLPETVSITAKPLK